jgi:hypothetical protein
MWKGTGLPQTWPGKIKHKRMYRCYGDWQHTQLLTHLFFFFDAFLGTVWVLFGHLFGALFATRSSCLHLVSLGPTWFPFVLLPTWSHFFLRVYTWYTWFHLVSLGPTSSYFPLGPTSFFVSTPGTLGSIWFHLVPLGSTWFHLVPLRPTSYRRRIVAQRKKQTKDPDNEKRNELLVTLENKLVAAEANFNSVDVVLRREMQWVIDNKHNLVHKQMVMCMCCYSEFYKRANAEFVNVVENIPEGN